MTDRDRERRELEDIIECFLTATKAGRVECLAMGDRVFLNQVRERAGKTVPLPTPSPVDEAREAFIDSERRVRLVEASRPLTVSEKALKFRELCAERRSRNLAWDALLAAEAKKGGSQC